MKTIKQVYKESLDRINGEEAVTEIATEIQRVTNALAKAELEKWSADQLSRALTKLAIFRVNLGVKMVDAMAFYDISYINRKLRYATEWKPTKNKLNKVLKRATIQDVDAAIQEKLAVDYQAEAQQKHYSERLKVIYDATETLITALQSRLGVLKQERYEARHS